MLNHLMKNDEFGHTVYFMPVIVRVESVVVRSGIAPV